MAKDAITAALRDSALSASMTCARHSEELYEIAWDQLQDITWRKVSAFFPDAIEYGDGWQSEISFYDILSRAAVLWLESRPRVIRFMGDEDGVIDVTVRAP